MQRLPDKASELLQVALNDYRLVKDDPRYNINMQRWHSPYESVCQVCLAGAVMAKSLTASPRDTLCPASDKIGIRSMYKLYALDGFRKGNMGSSLCALKQVYPAFILNEDNRVLDDIGVDEETMEGGPFFEAYIESLIGILQSEGL